MSGIDPAAFMAGAGPCVYCDATMGDCSSRATGVCCRNCAHPLDTNDQLAGSVSAPRVPKLPKLPTLQIDPEQLANVSRAFADLRVQLAALAVVAEQANRSIAAATKAWRDAQGARLEDDGEGGGK